MDFCLTAPILRQLLHIAQCRNGTRYDQMHDQILNPAPWAWRSSVYQEWVLCPLTALVQPAQDCLFRSAVHPYMGQK